MWLVNTTHNKNNKIRLPLISRWLTLFSLILSHNVNKNFLHKTPYFEKPKANSTLRWGFRSNFLSFSCCTKCSHQLPPKSPSDFIKSWINALCLEPRLFLSSKSTAKICPLHFLPCVPIPATRVPTGRPLAHLLLTARGTHSKMRLPQQVLLHHWHHPNPFNPSCSRGLPRTKSCI